MHEDRLLVIPAAEGKDLSDEILCSLARLEDLLQIAVDRAFFRYLIEGQFGVTDYGGQNVVKVVGYAPGKRAYRLHLVSLAELFFENRLSGYVPAADDVVGHDTQLVAHGRDVDLEFVGTTSWPFHRKPAIPSSLALKLGPQGCKKGLVFALNCQVGNPHSYHLFPSFPGKAKKRHVCILKNAGSVGNQDHLYSLFDYEGQTAPLILGPYPFTDVAQPHQSGWFSPVDGPGPQGFYVDYGPILLQAPEFEATGRAFVAMYHPVDLRHPFPVKGNDEIL